MKPPKMFQSDQQTAVPEPEKPVKSKHIPKQERIAITRADLTAALTLYLPTTVIERTYAQQSTVEECKRRLDNQASEVERIGKSNSDSWAEINNIQRAISQSPRWLMAKAAIVATLASCILVFAVARHQGASEQAREWKWPCKAGEVMMPGGLCGMVETIPVQPVTQPGCRDWDPDCNNRKLEPTAGELLPAVPCSDNGTFPLNCVPVPVTTVPVTTYDFRVTSPKSCWMQLTLDGQIVSDASLTQYGNMVERFARGAHLLVRSGCPGQVGYFVNNDRRYPPNVSHKPEQSEVAALP